MSGILTASVGLISSRPRVTALIESDTDRLVARDAITAAGWLGGSVEAIIEIAPGVKVYSAVPGDPALDSGSPLPDGSTLTIINKGLIGGAGGEGGLPKRFAVPGEDSTAWNFEEDAEGFDAQRATISVSNSILTLTPTETDPTLRTPSGLSIDGSKVRYVRLRVLRKAGAGWDGRLFYQTAEHAFSSSYTKIIDDTTVQGSWVDLVWDMWSLTSGGDDWKESTITRMRVDLGANSSDVFDIQWVVAGDIADYLPEPIIDGQAGGDAIRLQMDADIDNAEGYIFGGGGGGGGVVVFDILEVPPEPVRWAGGGGGQGTDGGPGGVTGTTDTTGEITSTDGTDGTESDPGAGGVHANNTGEYGFSQLDGGGGGAWGEAGANGSVSYVAGVETVLGDGGEPGKAVALNGHSVNWIAGNNETRVKGAVA